jgi:hypothetical protein
MGMGTTGSRVLLRWNQSTFAHLVLVPIARDQGTPFLIFFDGNWLTKKDRTFGEIDVLFEHRIPARKFKYTKADRESALMAL